MKKIFIVYGLLIAAVIILAVMKFGNFDFFNRTQDVTINDRTFEVTVAQSDEERINGLSNRENLGENEGMLFVFEEKDRYKFWMRNMKFPIDIIYISDNKVVDIKKNAEPANDEQKQPVIYAPSQPANYVLEINAGLADEYGMKIGDEVTLPNL